METQDMTQLRAFFTRLREDSEFQEAFRRHMGQAMREMDADIRTMQQAMNGKIAAGFLDYAHGNGYPVPEGEIAALLQSVDEGLHRKMGEIFRNEFAAAIGKMPE